MNAIHETSFPALLRTRLPRTRHCRQFTYRTLERLITLIKIRYMKYRPMNGKEGGARDFRILLYPLCSGLKCQSWFRIKSERRNFHVRAREATIIPLKIYKTAISFQNFTSETLVDSAHYTFSFSNVKLLDSLQQLIFPPFHHVSTTRP